MSSFIYTMKGLGKIYPPDAVVFKDIWLSFLYGAKIGVLGANGAGKSTLLKIMAGLDLDYSGRGDAVGRVHRRVSAAGARRSIRRRRCSATSRRAWPPRARS